MLPLVILGVKRKEWTVAFSVRMHLINPGPYTQRLFGPYHRCDLGLALAGGKTLQSAEYLLLIVSKHEKKKRTKNRKADQRLPK